MFDLISLWTITGALLLSLTITPSLSAEVKRIELPKEGTAFAFDHKSGTLAAVNFNENSAMLYPRTFFEGDSSAAIGPVDVGSSPGKPAFKRYRDKLFLAVPCYRESKITVLDGINLERIKMFATKSTGNRSVSASQNPDDPFLYFPYTLNHNGYVGVINLETMEIEDEGIRHRNSSYADPFISGDGKFLYVEGGAYKRSGEDGRGAMKFMASRISRTGVVSKPDLRGEYTAHSRILYDRALRRKIANYDFHISDFHPTKPLLFGFEKKKLFSASTNNFRILAETDIEFDIDDYRKIVNVSGLDVAMRERLLDARQRAFADPETGYVIIVRYGNQVLLVPESDLNPDPEPLLTAIIEFPEILEVGVPAKIPVQFSTAEMKKELVNAPEGMKLEDGFLSWTPTEEDLGAAEVELVLESGTIRRHLHYLTRVSRKSLPLPFYPQRLAISPDGSRIVATRVGSRSDPKTHFAVIDAESMNLISSKPIDTPPPEHLATDGNLIFTIKNRGVSVEVFSADTLEPVTNYPVNSPSKIQVSPNGKYLAVLCRTTEGSPSRSHATRLLALPDLKLPAEGELPEMIRTGKRYRNWGFGTWSTAPLTSVVEGLHLIDGYGYSEDYQKMTLWSFPHFLPFYSKKARPYRLAKWNRVIRSRAVSRPAASGGTPGVAATPVRELHSSFGESYVMKMDDYPAAVLYSWKYIAPSNISSAAAEIKIHELTRGNEVKSIILDKDVEVDRAAVSDNMGSNPRNPIIASGSRLYAVLADRVYRIDLDPEELGNAEAFPQPINFVPRQSAFHVARTGNTVLEHKTVGGTGPIKFSLTEDYDCMSIDKETGTVTINGPELIKAAGEGVFGIDMETGELIFEEESKRDRLKFAFRSYGENELNGMFEEVTGEKLKGFPLSVLVCVKAEDANDDSAVLSYGLAFDFPGDLYNKVIESYADPKLSAYKRPEGDNYIPITVETQPSSIPSPAATGISTDTEGGFGNRGSHEEGRLIARLDQIENRIANLEANSTGKSAATNWNLYIAVGALAISALATIMALGKKHD